MPELTPHVWKYNYRAEREGDGAGELGGIPKELFTSLTKFLDQDAG